jgi:hypothetical protein
MLERIMWGLGLSSLLMLSDVALAAVSRSFVSTSGSDANVSSNCGPSTPCRTFSGALSVTNAGGEVVVLSSGGYGVATITQAVSIVVSPGIYAGASVGSGADGMTINAPGATVRISGLTINGLGGTNGVNVVAAGEVDLERVTIRGMVDGILANTNGAVIYLSNSTITNNSASGISASSPGTRLYL